MRNHFLNEDSQGTNNPKGGDARAQAMQKGGIGIDFNDIRINVIRGCGKGSH